jgi:hypothetical protein
VEVGLGNHVGLFGWWVGDELGKKGWEWGGVGRASENWPRGFGWGLDPFHFSQI